jgi:cytochrome P450
MIEAGSETTSQALNNTIVGLLQNPEAVKKAHEELDRVVGTDRTPTFDDEDNLPYVRAIIKVPYSNQSIPNMQETLRWRTVNKMGQNHFVIQDDWYEGYFIPKNTIIMMNLWAMHYNEEDFPEPEKVSPKSGKGANSSTDLSDSLTIN